MRGDTVNIANLITWSRILLAGVGWVFALLNRPVLLAWTLLIAGISDALDGYLARKLNISSKHGAWLDSFADAILMISAFAWVLLLTPLFAEHPYAVLVGIGAQLFAYGVSLVKHGKLAALHLTSSKLMAWVAYAFIVHALLFSYSVLFLYVCALALTYAGIEEAYLLLKYKDIPVEKSSMFTK